MQSGVEQFLFFTMLLFPIYLSLAAWQLPNFCIYTIRFFWLVSSLQRLILVSHLFIHPQVASTDIDLELPVHTSYPELIYGASHIILAPTHLLLKKKEFLQCLSSEVQQQLKEMDSQQIGRD